MVRSSYVFTSESVSEGHPDKVADRISDTVVDAFISEDPEARVACETMVTTNRIILAGEVRAGIGQQNRQLEREGVLTVEVLMQAVVVVDSVLKEKRRRPYLTCTVTTLDEVGMLFRIAHIDSHRFIPTIGDGDQMRIDCRPEFAQPIGKRVAEILVLSAPEAVPLHDDATAKDVIIRVKTGNGPALLRGKKLF